MEIRTADQSPMREETHMADLPDYPDSDEDTSVGPDRRSSRSTSWRRYLLVLVVVALVMLFVILHLTGTVGPGTN
jgi:hypothetical protein